MELFDIIRPEADEVPVLIGFPHSGSHIPEELVSNYRQEAIDFIDDTDWFLPRLYEFAPSLGITQIRANYSRWVIDLNRDPKSIPLYNDGRLITGLCTSTNFLGAPIYKDDKEPDADEVNRRLDKYFWPYYRAIQSTLDGFIQKFGYCILYDSHSIRSVVPSIQKERFPDMILGTASGKSASDAIIQKALTALRNGPYEVTYNYPFKGGHITRYFGRPEQGQHALQLERCKDLYMSNNEMDLDQSKADKMTATLKNLFESLID